MHTNTHIFSHSMQAQGFSHTCAMHAGLISLRHYSISVAPSGIRKSLKSLLQHKSLPKMGDFQDVSEFITKSGYGSVR